MAPGTALLWVVGEEDPENLALGKSYAFERAPSNPHNRTIVVPKGHVDAPATGATPVAAWLRCL